MTVQHRLGSLRAQHGRAVLPDGSGGRTAGLHVSMFKREGRESFRRVVALPEGLRFGRFTSRLNDDGRSALDAFIRSQLPRIADRLDIVWAGDQHGVWAVAPGSPDAVKAAKRPVLSMCAEYANDDGYGGGGCCGRPIYDDAPICGMHNGVAKRAEATQARRAAEKAERDEKRELAKRRTAELQELWAIVCDQRDIAHRGNRPHVSGSAAIVDSEVMNTLLRELLERGS